MSDIWPRRELWANEDRQLRLVEVAEPGQFILEVNIGDPLVVLKVQIPVSLAADDRLKSFEHHVEGCGAVIYWAHRFAGSRMELQLSIDLPGHEEDDPAELICLIRFDAGTGGWEIQMLSEASDFDGPPIEIHPRDS